MLSTISQYSRSKWCGCVYVVKIGQFPGTSGVLGSTQIGHYMQYHAVTGIILHLGEKLLWN